MKLKIGDKVISNGLTMIIESETKTYYKGSYEGRKNSVAILTKDTLINPHYLKNITIVKA